MVIERICEIFGNDNSVLTKEELTQIIDELAKETEERFYSESNKRNADNYKLASLRGKFDGYEMVIELLKHLNNDSLKNWIITDADSGSFGEYEPFIEFKCPECKSGYGIESGQYGWQYGEPIPWVYCPLCGAKIKGGAEQ